MTRRPLVRFAALGALGLCIALSATPAWADAPGAPAQAPSTPMLTPPAPTLTLDQVVQEALARNPSVIAAQEALTAAQLGIVVARAGLAPTVSATGTGTAGTSSSTSFTTSAGNVVPLSGPSVTGSVSLAGTLPVYDAGRTPAAVGTAEAARAAAEGALRQSQQDTSLAVATAFFNVLTAEHLTAVQEALLTQARDQLALTEARVKAGVAARADVYQAQAQVAQAQVNLLQAQSQIATAKSGLQGTMGADPSTPVEVQEPQVPPLEVAVSADVAMNAAAANRPEVAKSVATVQTDQAALALARINAGPQVTVGVSAGYTPVSTSPVLNNSTFYGLTTTVALPLYNIGARAGVDQAQATLRAAQAALTATILSVRQDAYQSYLTAVQDAATIPATRAAQQAADQALVVAEGQYRAGVGTFVGVVTAQATAAQADVNAVNALYTYQSALATLRHAQGMPIVASTRGGSQ